MMKKRSPIHAYKRLLAKDHDWDYAYLIALENGQYQLDDTDRKPSTSTT